MSMKSSQRFSALLFAALFALTGCSTGSETQAQLSGINLTMWVDAELKPAAEVIAQQVRSNTGHTMTLVEKDFASIEAELLESGESAPDLFIGSSEWTDRLASNGFVASLGDAKLAGFSDAVVRGTSFAGSLYGVPYSIESLALVCDAERVASQPRTGEELIALGYRVVLNPGGDAYTMLPVQSSFGILPLALDEFGDWQESTGFGATRGVEFATWLSENKDSFREIDYSTAVTGFVNGNQPCLLTGPWALNEIRERVQFEPKVYNFPSFGGEPALSFSSARAVFVSGFSKNLEASKEVARYFSTEAVQQLIFQQIGRVPAMETAAAKTADPLVEGFSRAGSQTLVLPGSGAMQNTWVPWTRALNSLLRSDETPATVWSQLLTDVEKVNG